jgi:esterase/lipase
MKHKDRFLILFLSFISRSYAATSPQNHESVFSSLESFRKMRELAIPLYLCVENQIYQHESSLYAEIKPQQEKSKNIFYIRGTSLTESRDVCNAAEYLAQICKDARIIHCFFSSLYEKKYEEVYSEINKTFRQVYKKNQEKWCLVTYSSGSVYGVRLAAHFPEAFEKIILISPCANISKTESLWEKELENKEKLIENAKKDSSECLDFMREKVLPGQDLSCVSEIFMHQEELAKINCSIHVVCGEHDCFSVQQHALYKKFLKECKYSPFFHQIEKQKHAMFYCYINHNPLILKQEREVERKKFIEKKKPVFETIQNILSAPENELKGIEGA